MSCHVMLCHVMPYHAMPYNDQAYAHLGLVLSLSVCIVPDTWNDPFETITLLTRPIDLSAKLSITVNSYSSKEKERGLTGDNHILLQELWMAGAIPWQQVVVIFVKQWTYAVQQAVSSNDKLLVQIFQEQCQGRNDFVSFFSGTYVYGTYSTAPKQCHMMYTYICIKCDKRVWHSASMEMFVNHFSPFLWGPKKPPCYLRGIQNIRGEELLCTCHDNTFGTCTHLIYFFCIPSKYLEWRGVPLPSTLS